MSFGKGWGAPFFSGTSSVSTLVPAIAPAAIHGRPYLIDLNEYDRLTIDAIRQQADQSDEVGEQSFNPAGLWLRSQDSWHRGAGQELLDYADSDRRRYWTSKGINPWEFGKLQLHHAVDEKLSSANANLTGCAVGSHLYLLDGQSIKFTAGPSVATPAWTTVTGTPAESPSWITTDGYRVFVAYPSGVYTTNRAAATATALGSQDVGLVSYVKGRLLISFENELFEMDAAGVATSLYAHPNPDFRWTAVEAGDVAIYAAGYSGDKTEIYRIAMDDTTTALASPTPATSWPDGEILHAMRFYSGMLILGTSRGLRLGRPNTSGNFDYFGPIETDVEVRCLEPDGDYCWFGWTNYDNVSTGLGRIDLSAFLEDQDLVPAYASDLMADGQGVVSSVMTVAGCRYFTVAGLGVFGEDDVLVQEGTVEFGRVRYRTTEQKMVRSIDLRTEPLAGSVAVYVAADDLSYTGVATLDTEGSTGPIRPWTTGQIIGEQLAVRAVLARSAADPTAGPVVTRYTMRALARPPREDRILVPVILSTIVTNDYDANWQVNPLAEFLFLKNLEANATVVTYQEGSYTTVGFIEQVRWKPSSWQPGHAWMNGICYVTLQTLGSA